jgi:hypothetical protein
MLYIFMFCQSTLLLLISLTDFSILAPSNNFMFFMGERNTNKHVNYCETKIYEELF